MSPHLSYFNYVRLNKNQYTCQTSTFLVNSLDYIGFWNLQDVSKNHNNCSCWSSNLSRWVQYFYRLINTIFTALILNSLSYLRSIFFSLAIHINSSQFSLVRFIVTRSRVLHVEMEVISGIWQTQHHPFLPKVIYFSFSAIYFLG